ncbi:MAG: biotin-dependent carboxyltransferase family protein [Pyrinomonadaceae bacterium]
MSLIFKKPGILTTIQDLGRIGARNLGINPSGVMDRSAAKLINIVLGNPDTSPVLEFHFPAPEIEFGEDTRIAIGGADFGARIDDTPRQNWSSWFVKKGSVLKFARPASGRSAYLAVSGGFEIDQWLGSSSTNLAAMLGGLSGRKLVARDEIAYGAPGVTPEIRIGQSITSCCRRFPTMRFVAGNEFQFLTALGERTLLGEDFAVTDQSDRMGYRLEGKPVHLLHELQMVSAAVTFGTLQLLPDGQIIILMADHQTSGGYPRIGNVVSVDLPRLAQCGPGERISFSMVSVQEAERLALQYEKDLNFLRAGCRFRNQNGIY